MEDHLRLVSVVYESDVNITALGDPSGPLSHDLWILFNLELAIWVAGIPGWFSFRSGTHDDSDSKELASLRIEAEYLVFPGIQPLWWLKSSRDGNTDYSCQAPVMATRILHFGKRIEDCTDSFLTLVFDIFVITLGCGLFFSLPLNQAREAPISTLDLPSRCWFVILKGPISEWT